MLKLLINITDLMRSLGWWVLFLLPCVALVIVACALYVIAMGVSLIIESLSTNIFCIKEKKDILKNLGKDIKRGRYEN